MSTQKFNYQNYLTGYTMPFNYLWALLVMTGDKEFVLELADLVYNSQIEITVFDDYTVASNSIAEKYTVTAPRIREFTKTTKTTNITYNTKVDLTRANVWIVDYINEYEYMKKINGAEWKQKGSKRIDKIDVNSEEPNFENILKKHSDALGFFYNYRDSLFKVLENPNNGLTDMLDLTKYLWEVQKNGSADNVDEKDRFDFSVFDPNNFKNRTYTGFVGSDLEQKIWFMLTDDLNYSEYCAAGAMGNFAAETDSGTSINNKCVEQKTDELSTAGEGHGIAQWSGGRKTDLLDYAKSIGKDWSDEDVQLEFLKAELSGGGCNGYAKDQRYTVKSEYDAFIASTSPEDAALHFNGFYELCNTGIESHDRNEVRKQGARYYYDKFHGLKKSDVVTTGGPFLETAREMHKAIKESGFVYCDTVGIYTTLDGCGTHMSRNLPHASYNTFEEALTGHRYVNCYAFVSWVLVRCGYFQPGQHVNTPARDTLESKGWKVVTNEIVESESNLQPGDIISWKNPGGECHGEIYIGNGMVLSCGGNYSINNEVALSNRNHSDRTYAWVARPPQSDSESSVNSNKDKTKASNNKNISQTSFEEMKKTGQGKMRDIVSGKTKDIYGNDLVERMRKGSLRLVNAYGGNESVIISNLSYLIIPYKDFNGNTQIGEMIVEKGNCAKSTLLVFKELFDIGYPIERMTLIDDYDSANIQKVENDWRSIQANNTAAFNYRVANDSVIDRTDWGLSNHAKRYSN